MDKFHEQLVKIKPKKSVIFAKSAIWTSAAIIALLSFFFGTKITPLLFLIGAAALYLAYKANSSFNIEYEYIFTNGTLDIDKIVNKSTRTNTVSFECKNIEEIKKYRKSNPLKSDKKTFICTDDTDNAYIFCVSAEKIGKCRVVFSPDDDIKHCIKPYTMRIPSELTF